MGKEIAKSDSIKKKKIFLTISIVGNLGLLGFFKYADFGISQFNQIASYIGFEKIPLLELVLPIGISFYTFQTLSYSIDIYRGILTPSKSLKEFSLFVVFFPQLVAGPIVRAKDFLPQLREKINFFESKNNLKQIIIHNKNLQFGITLMAFGFLKKMFFADNISPFVNEIFLNPTTLESFSVILGSIAFGIQIYGDFSGYTDIALGAALILGFKLPENFNKPYFAISPADFWRKWHMSLSNWVRDYVYFPLVFNNPLALTRIFLALIFSFFLLGLWHGGDWNFIIFGLLHGLFVASDVVLHAKIKSKKISNFFKSKIGKISAILITQYLVFLAWIPFRISNLGDLGYVMSKYVFWDFQFVNTVTMIQSNKLAIFLIFSFLILHFISYKQKNLKQIIGNLKLRYWYGFLLSVMLAILFFYDGNPQNFVYFNF